MKNALLLSVVLTVALVGCRSETPKADPPVEEAPRELTAKERATEIRAKLAVVAAVDSGSTQALRQVEKLGTESVSSPPQELDAAKKFTIFFGANNHGERNDCGCRKNPLGGLGRRHTMLNALGQEAGEIWEQGPAAGPVFHVDAGDLLFAHNTLDQQAPEAQKTAKYDAESVAAALATFPPDALLVGEHDLVFGADFVEKIAKKHKLSFISANVQRKGKLVFPPSVVVERDGVKVGIVGVTKPNSRRGDFYETRDLQVLDPAAAVKSASAGFEGVDAVVVLSNLGLADTKTLVDTLRNDDVRVDLAIASSTNRMTSTPEFSNGVPVMEPLSRGKYLGRADLWVSGAGQTQYQNASAATPARLRDYRRAVRSYWASRKQLLHEQLKVAEAEMTLDSLENSQQPDAGEAASSLVTRRKKAIENQRKRLPTLQTRVATTSEALLQQVSNTKSPDGEPTGDDWIAGTVVPVKIEFEGEKKTRAVLDPREKKRPAK